MPLFSFDMTTANWAAAALRTSAAIHHSLPAVPFCTLPPHFFSASRQHLVRRQCAIQCWMPLTGNLWINGGKIIKARQHFLIGAIGASAATLCSTGHDRLISMALVTDPPHLAIARWCNMLRPQRAIFCWVPLPRDLRKLACKVIFTGNDFLSSAYRTAASRHTRSNRCLPFVTLRTAPPHLAFGARDNIFWCQHAVFSGMPLLRQLRIIGCEIIVTLQHLFIGTNWAAYATDTRLDLSIPLMPLCAAPPHMSVAARQHIARCQIAILLRMPLCCQKRIACAKVRFAFDRIATAAVGTACTTASACVYSRLLEMAIHTSPPHLSFASITGRFRGQREIAFRVPFSEQIFSPCAMTKIGQAFSHACHLQFTENSILC